MFPEEEARSEVAFPGYSLEPTSTHPEQTSKDICPYMSFFFFFWSKFRLAFPMGEKIVSGTDLKIKQ